MNYSKIENTPKKIRLLVGFLIQCDNCRCKTQSALTEKEDYINDGNKNRFCTVCGEMFVSSPVFEVLNH